MNTTKLQYWGWLLFIGSAIFYIISSLRSGDLIGLLGGVCFLLACIIFLFALSRK